MFIFQTISKKRMNFRKFLSFLLLLIAGRLFAVIPQGYYSSASGLKDQALKTAIFNIIKQHTQLEYYTSSTYFRTTDWHPNGYFWDMYSNIQRTSWTGMNREHNFPKSWWSSAPETTVAYSDLHNLYPSDPTANEAKSNYPLGEVTGTPDFQNGVVKVGTNRVSGYNGTVFEPADEYKGDFARSYMYIVTCYQDYSQNWRSLGIASMLQKNTYPVFNEYAINLLLKWHRNDPVSEKETNRNDGVYSFQKNRNPFVDFPALAEYIWGYYKGQAWDENGEISVPDPEFYTVYLPDENKLYLNITENKPADFFIYSVDGILVQNGTTNSKKIGLSTDKNGLFIVVLYNSGTRKVAKFIKHN